MSDYTIMNTDTEKQPLIEGSAPAALDVLKQRVADAQQGLFNAQKEFRAAWLQTKAGKKWTVVSKCLMVFAITILATYLLGLLGLIAFAMVDSDEETSEYLPRRVPLEAHIMSKCPDAKDCLHDLVLPAMQNVSHYVDFKLSYIGSYVLPARSHAKSDQANTQHSTTSEVDDITCKHGPQECLGNTLELCAAHLYPNPKIYLGFTMCMTRSFEQIASEDLIHDCALEHGIDFSRLNDCVSDNDGAMGVKLLRQSVERSQDAGVTKSCTIRLDSKVRCIRDGGVWVDCEDGHEVGDLVADVLELRNQHSPAWKAEQAAA